MGKVMFDYEATQANELTIKVEDIVEAISDKEPGWYAYNIMYIMCVCMCMLIM